MASLDHNMLIFSYMVAGHAFLVTNDNGKVMKNNSSLGKFNYIYLCFSNVKNVAIIKGEIYDTKIYRFRMSFLGLIIIMVMFVGVDMLRYIIH